MQEPKRHHYVPQMLSRRFTNQNGKLYCFHKNSRGRVFEATPKDAFVEKHLYARYDEHGNKDVSAEKELAKLEGQASEVIKKIIEEARLRELPSLTSSEKEIWDRFCYCQFLRTPEGRAFIQNHDFVSEALTNFENEIRPLTDDEREKFHDPKEQPTLMSNIWVNVVAGTPREELFEILRSKQDVGIGIVVNPKKSFIIGSNPIFFVGQTYEHTNHSDPDVGTMFPISHDIIVATGGIHGKAGFVEINEMNGIREINETIFNLSNMAAARSRELMESLAGLRGPAAARSRRH